MAESVDIIVQAHDQASAKLAQISNSVDKFGKTAKASGKTLGAFNQILGSTPFGQYTSGLANMTGEIIEARTAFEGLGKASLLAKGGLLALGGVLSVNIAKWTRDAINNITGLNSQIDELIKKQAALSDQEAFNKGLRHKEALQDLDAIEDPAERLKAQQAYQEGLDRELKRQQDLLAVDEARLKRQDRWYRADVSDKDIEKIQSDITAGKARVDQLEQQRRQLVEMTSAHEQERQAIERTKEAEKQRADMRKKWRAEEQAHFEEMARREQEAAEIQSKNIAAAMDLNAKQAADQMQESIDQDRERRRLKQAQDDADVASFEHWAKLQGEMEERRKAVKQKETDRLMDLARQERQPTVNTAFESRTLARGPSTDPINRVAKATEELNKKATEQAKAMKEMAKSMDKLARNKTALAVIP